MLKKYWHKQRNTESTDPACGILMNYSIFSCQLLSNRNFIGSHFRLEMLTWYLKPGIANEKMWATGKKKNTTWGSLNG